MHLTYLYKNSDGKLLCSMAVPQHHLPVLLLSMGETLNTVEAGGSDTEHTSGANRGLRLPTPIAPSVMILYEGGPGG